MIYFQKRWPALPMVKATNIMINAMRSWARWLNSGVKEAAEKAEATHPVKQEGVFRKKNWTVAGNVRNLKLVLN